MATITLSAEIENLEFIRKTLLTTEEAGNALAQSLLVDTSENIIGVMKIYPPAATGTRNILEHWHYDLSGDDGTYHSYVYNSAPYSMWAVGRWQKRGHMEHGWIKLEDVAYDVINSLGTGVPLEQAAQTLVDLIESGESIDYNKARIAFFGHRSATGGAGAADLMASPTSVDNGGLRPPYS